MALCIDGIKELIYLYIYIATLLRTCYMPGIELRAEDVAVNKKKPSHKTYIGVER